MKIFMVDDSEYWAGASRDEVKQFYLGQVDDRDIEHYVEYLDEYLTEISEDQLKKLIFNDDDGSKRTFEDELKRMIESGQEFPCIFAVTEG